MRTTRRTIMATIVLTSFQMVILLQSANAAATRQTTQGGATEVSAPQASASTTAMLAEGDKLLAAKKYAETVISAEKTGIAAASAKDAVGEALAQRQRAIALQGLSKLDEATSAWRQTRELWGRFGDGPGQVEAYGAIWSLSGTTDRAVIDGLKNQISIIANSEIKRPRRVAITIFSIGAAAHGRGDLDTAEWCYTQSLAIREKLAPESLDVAKGLTNLAFVASDRGNPAKAEIYDKRALAIQKRLAPNSIDVAQTLNSLGNAAADLAHPDRAETLYKEALAIELKLAPESIDVAYSYNNLGTLANDRGDLTAAESYNKLALAMLEKLAPGSRAVAASMNNIGNIADSRGDLLSALKYYRSSMEIRQRIAPGGIEAASSVVNIANVERELGNLALALEYGVEALTDLKRLAPDSTYVAASLNNLGIVEEGLGDLDASEGYYRQALAIHEKLAPNSLSVATSLGNLGNLAYSRRDFREAEKYHSASTKILEKLSPDSLDLASCINNLANVYHETGRLALSVQYLERCLKIRNKLAPNSLSNVQTYNCLAAIGIEQGNLTRAQMFAARAQAILELQAPDTVARIDTLMVQARTAERLNELSAASKYLLRAVDILEKQRERITTAESRSLFVSKHSNTYSELTRIQIAGNDRANAYLTAERARGRSLSDSLFERQIDFTSDVPKELLDRQAALDNERRIVLTARERLKPNDPKSAPAYTANSEKLKSLAARQRELETEIRPRSPKYAALQYPKPLDLQSVQKTLDPGTLLLEYALDTDKSYLFAVTRSTFHLYTLSVKREDLVKKIAILRESVSSTNAARNPQIAVQLYDLLLRPAQKEIAASKRLLLCPEGELLQLPFAALIDNAQPQLPHYLVQSKPLHSIVAMNVYAQLKQERERARSSKHSLLAFGDPAYAQPGKPTLAGAATVSIPTPEAEQQRFVKLGGTLERVPITGQQVKEIGTLYGSEAVVHVGEEATRKRVLAEAPYARILHFACHGLLDNVDPLNSRLALTPEDGKDDGMLRAYDVMSHLKLNADLVVLGSCQSGLGKAQGAEGVIGLTRAFQYAGAKSVLVSLWEIDAISATQLLESFHKTLRFGASKDEALRQAQISFITGSKPEYRDPVYWAAFSLQGDWK